MFVKNLTYQGIKKLTRLLAVIPVGSIEQHGPYLPLGTDSIVAENLAVSLEKKMTKKVIVYPTIWYGCSKEHNDFPGTVSLEFTTFFKLATEILETIFKTGFKKVVFLGGHGGNHLILQLICQNWNYEHTKQKAYYLFAFNKEIDRKALKLFGDSEPHAGSVETSLIYALNNQYIKTRRQTFIIKGDKEKIKRNYDLYKTSEMSESGIIARDPKVEINIGKGKLLYQKMIEILRKDLKDILKENYG